ncbi:hypothetical protein GBF38_000822 [Nibea albiflora]|nr:hypothetical protein GBF38_000822 [Nibea albiflora]
MENIRRLNMARLPRAGAGMGGNEQGRGTSRGGTSRGAGNERGRGAWLRTAPHSRVSAGFTHSDPPSSEQDKASTGLLPQITSIHVRSRLLFDHIFPYDIVTFYIEVKDKWMDCFTSADPNVTLLYDNNNDNENLWMRNDTAARLEPCFPLRPWQFPLQRVHP